MSTSFSCTAYGKCILAGEHSVLRGVPALVVPLKSRALTLHYHSGEESLSLELQGDHGKDLQLLVWGVLDRACDLKKIERRDLKGRLYLESSIPVGAGMGASGALCVALTRWLGFLGLVSESEYYDFARTLEDLFHGESSGVDIAVALWGQGLRFVRGGEKQALKFAWQPRWYISYTGQRGVTLEAVNQVKSFIAANPQRGQALDLQMKAAVTLAEEALTVKTADSFMKLQQALEMAAGCFADWGLNNLAVQKHMAWLREQGAVALKPTGSGGGGYILSLWDQEPPAAALSDLIPC